MAKLLSCAAVVALCVSTALLAATSRIFVSLHFSGTGQDGRPLHGLSAVPAPALDTLSTAAAPAGASASAIAVENGYTNRTVFSQSHGNRLLLYFTTFPKREHMEILVSCWPALISRGKMLRNADVVVFLGGNATADELSRWRLAVAKLGANAILHHDPSNPGRQQGAMRAVHMLMQNGWWKGYDWVVRVNPDVLIYDDAHLETFFLNRNLSAVLANCGTVKIQDPRQTQNAGLGRGKVHTDFFAMRPSHIPEGAFADWETAGNAELQATRVFRDIIQRKECAWLLPSNVDRACRVRGEFFDYDVPLPCSM